MINEFQANYLLEGARSSLDVSVVEILLRLLNAAFTLDDLGISGRRPTIMITDVDIGEAGYLYSLAQQVLDDDQMASLTNLLSEWFYFDDLGPTSKRVEAVPQQILSEQYVDTAPVEVGGNGNGWMLPLLALGAAYFFLKRS